MDDEYKYALKVGAPAQARGLGIELGQYVGQQAGQQSPPLEMIASKLAKARGLAEELCGRVCSVAEGMLGPETAGNLSSEKTPRPVRPGKLGELEDAADDLLRLLQNAGTELRRLERM